MPGSANKADSPSRGDSSETAAAVEVPWPDDAAAGTRRHAALGHAHRFSADRKAAADIEDRGLVRGASRDDDPGALALRYDYAALALAAPELAPPFALLREPITGKAVAWPGMCT